MFSSILASCLLIFSQDITLPETIKAPVGTFVPITANTKGEDVVFVTLDPGLSVFPSNLLVDRKTTVVVAAQEGRYRVLAYTAIGGKPTQPAYTTVVVGNPKPDDNKPKPDDNKPKPDDNKPKPDDNKPIPPENPLATTLRGIYGGLQESDKSESIKRLRQIYELAVVQSDNPEFKTLGQLYANVRSAAIQSIRNDKVVPIREAIANELDNMLGTEASKLLDPAMRLNCKQAFKMVSNALGGLNG